MGKLLNMVFLGLSNWIFSATSGIYTLFYGLATTRLFRADTIQDVSNRIYILVSVVILFAFSVKLIEAIVNPDLLTDAKKGVTGVLKRTIIGLLLIVAVPAIFNFVYYLQAEIIVGGVIEKLMLGYVDSDSESGVEGAGGELTSTIITSFIIPIDANGVALTESGLCGGDTNCNYAQKLLDTNADYEPYVTFLGGDPKYENLNSINVDKVWEKGKPIYQINGLALVAVGCFVLYQIIILCMDAGLRLVKLGMLEILAPVVIVSYIAAGTDHLSKWAKMTVQEFTSILIRIAGLCFMVLGFKLMNDPNSIFNNDSVSFWFKVFLIIGLLRMVKEIPDLFGKLFGANIKMGSIKDKLGEMAGIGKMAQNAWSGIGGIAKASPQLLAAAGRGVGRGFRKLDNKLGDKGLGHKISGLKDRVSDKLNSNEKFNKVRNVAGKVGSFSKGAATSVAKAGKVVGAAYKSQGKDAKGAVNKALDENFKTERFEDKQLQEKKAKAKITAKIEKASGSAIKLKTDGSGKIDYGETVKGKNLNDVTRMNNEIVKNMGGFTDMQRDALKKLNSERSKYSDAKDKLDKFNDVDSMFNKMLESTDNQEQRGAITRAQNLLHAGKLFSPTLTDIALDEIGKCKGEGTIDASTFEQMKEMTLKAHENASKCGALNKDQDTLKNEKETAEKDYNDQTSKVKTVEENIGDENVKAAFKAVSDTIDKSVAALEDRQRKEDYQKINSAIDYSQVIPTNNQSASQNSSTQQSSSNQANGSTESTQAGTMQVESTSGGTVKADIDTSKLEQKLDEINTSVQTGSKNVANQVRTSGEKINSNLRTTNETLGKMNTGIENINDALGDIKKTTKDTNDKMDQDE